MNLLFLRSFEDSVSPGTLLFSCVYFAGEREFRYPSEGIRDAKAEIKERVAFFPLVLAASRTFEISDNLKFDFKNRASSSAFPTVPPTFVILFFAKRVVEMCSLNFLGSSIC